MAPGDNCDPVSDPDVIVAEIGLGGDMVPENDGNVVALKNEKIYQHEFIYFRTLCIDKYEYMLH